MITLRPLPCPQCGAVLRLSDAEDGVAACPYCGTEIRVALPDPPPPPSPPAPPPIIIHVPVPAPEPRRGSSFGCIISLIFLAVPGVALYFALRDPAVARQIEEALDQLAHPTEPLATASTSAAAGSPNLVTPSCLTDADSDGILDVFYLGLQPSGGTYSATLASGADGHLLWSGEALRATMPLLCLTEPGGRTWLGYQHPTFEVVLAELPVASGRPKARHRFRLSDIVALAGTAAGCATFKTTDNRTTGVALPEGSPKECPAQAEPLSPLGTPTFQFSRTFNLPKRTVTVASRPQGTPLIRITAHDKTGRELFSREHELLALPFGIPTLMVGTDTVTVVGNTHPDGKGLILGIDVTTGRESWRVPLGRSIPGFETLMTIPGFGVAAGRVYVLNAPDIVVIDGTTGAILWRRAP